MLDLKYTIRGLSFPSGIVTYNQSFTSNTIFFFEKWPGGEFGGDDELDLLLTSNCSLLELNHHIVT
jgi:hypothetical protein